jgi:TldD protein
MKMQTRRDFIATTATIAAGSVPLARSLNAQSFQQRRLPASAMHSIAPASHWLPDRTTSTDLHGLAAAALDAARSAGATYADVRVAEQHFLHITGNASDAAMVAGAQIGVFLTYGVRVLVNGSWAFTHGNVGSTDALAATARSAVATARGYAALNISRQVAELAPAAAAIGEWTTPIQLDPFSVALGDQAALLSACAGAGARIRNAWLEFPRFGWTRETRAFASTEGTRITQTLYRSEPGIAVKAGLPLMGTVRRAVLFPTTGGYECVTAPELQDVIKAAADDMARLAWLPRRSLDVGRYPVVLDGTTTGILLARTLGRALESDRALGEEVAASGLSYLSPPSAIVGTAVASPLLQVKADRAVPSVTAVRWDDEGIEPREFAVITDGRVMRYFTSRRTAPAIRAEVAAHPAESLGCAGAPSAEDPVLVRAPHLAMTPGAVRLSLDDLCRDVRHGVLVREAESAMIDRTLASGFVRHSCVMLEIRNGQPVSRLDDTALQFSTARFWKSLSVLGDANTVQLSVTNTSKGQPDTSVSHSVRAPATRFKDVDIINTGKHV